jgi:hypothetical protein
MPTSKPASAKASTKVRRDKTLDRNFEKRSLSPEQRERQREEERERNRLQNQMLCEQENEFRSRLAKISDEEADAAIAQLPKSDKDKLTRFAKTEAQHGGYFKPEDGSAVFAAACRRVIKNLMASGLNLGEVEEGQIEEEEEAE